EAPKEKPGKKARKEEEPARERPRKKRRHYDEKELEISNIDKQANLNELFREDDDYYEEKHSGNSVVRIAIAVVAVVVLAFFIYKVASLSGQVTKLNEQVESYKTMESEYEQLKLDNLSLTEQVESLQAQLGGGTDNSSDNNNSGGTDNQTTSNTSTPASTTSGSKTYTVQAGDTYWSIATKMYGNGAYYERILKANNLTENDKLREGMTLTIPAA
ncbi:MAG: LysM peptidoglycan-binding domain-containing protein, partial [Clostridia bacterium]|nr:LysM peptidoglycan-binding domain-containing protein [Clostridia bacterium]